MDARALAERLITYDTSTPDGIKSAAGFIKGWLESHDLPVEAMTHAGRPVLVASVGAESGPTLVLHGHVDVVPGRPEQFEPQLDGDRLIGRGAYDMKGGLAGMMCALRDLAAQRDVRVRLLIVADEETEDVAHRGSDFLVEGGYVGDFAITGEPTELRIGVEAKGVLALQIEVAGKSAHGSTPWEGDNAVMKAVDVFRRIESLPFARASSELFDRPSINLGRIAGGDRVNKVPDSCVIDVDIRYLPGQDPDAIVGDIRALPDSEVTLMLHREPAMVDRRNPYVLALAQALGDQGDAERISVGRDGASDVVSFLRAGVPAVELGPVGGGHHGPEEWVSVDSLDRYRAALVEFARLMPRAGHGHLRVA